MAGKTLAEMVQSGMRASEEEVLRIAGEHSLGVVMHACMHACVGQCCFMHACMASCAFPSIVSLLRHEPTLLDSLLPTPALTPMLAGELLCVLAYLGSLRPPVIHRDVKVGQGLHKR